MRPGAAATEALPPASRPLADRPVSDGVRLVGAPFARYAPETAWGFGAGGFFWFHADPVARAAGRVSSFGASLQYTLRNQMGLSAIWDLYLSEGRLRANGAFDGERWPSGIWSPGSANGARGEPYTPRSAKAEVGLAARVVDAGAGRGLWLGLQARGRNDAIDGFDPGGLLARCAVVGCRGGDVLSLSATLAWDTRDHVLSPERGLLLEARAGRAAAWLGDQAGRRGFLEVELEARAWLPVDLPRGGRVSLQGRLHTAAGTVPFYMRPTFGGDHSLRGVLEGRRRDLDALSLQAEYGLPLFWRLGAALFGGAGQVAPRMGELSWQRFVPAGGAGLRFTVDRADRVVLRLDRGYSPGSASWYLSIGEAI